MSGPRKETAYAKINLALHVRRRREDGYHEIETLFAFLDDGDRLEMLPAEQFRLEGCDGIPLETNLITKVARAVNGGELPLVHSIVQKCLPVAAGLGGGSADAAAMMRLLDAKDRYDLAAQLGADVPACLNSVPVIGFGTGVELKPVENDVRGLSCLLVNPGVSLATGPVFQAWDTIDRGPMPEGSARTIMMSGRNDLEIPARSLCPVIGEVLASLAGTGAMLVRMSGSGASCFAVYDDHDLAARVRTRLTGQDHRDWWTMLGRLR